MFQSFAAAMAALIKQDIYSQQLLDCLPLLFRCGQNLVPTMSTSSIIQEDLAASLTVFKANVASSLSTIPHHSIVYCGVAVLHNLTSLIGEDFAITGHYGNCLRYLDLSIASLQCLPSGSMYRCVEYMAKARDSVRHRKRNINNKVIELDEIKRMNFLNRVDQLDQAMVALREMLLITIVRQHRSTRQHQMDCINGVVGYSSVDTSYEESEDEGPIPSLEEVAVTNRQDSSSVMINRIVPSNNNNKDCEEKNIKVETLPADPMAGDSSPATPEQQKEEFQ